MVEYKVSLYGDRPESNRDIPEGAVMILDPGPQDGTNLPDATLAVCVVRDESPYPGVRCVIYKNNDMHSLENTKAENKTPWGTGYWWNGGCDIPMILRATTVKEGGV